MGNGESGIGKAMINNLVIPANAGMTSEGRFGSFHSPFPIPYSPFPHFQCPSA
jgi:hypothetical protein